MEPIKGKLIEIISRTQSVKSFRFALELPFDFIPGQFVQVILDESDFANKKLNKYLSVSCAPGKDFIEVTKKLSESDFSKRLDSLKLGEQVIFKGPMGHCTFNGEYNKIAFLVGGIGITPAISILEYIKQEKLKTDIVLCYSNWTALDIAYKNELDSWLKEIPSLKIFHVLVTPDENDTKVFSGLITKEFIQAQMPDYKDRLIYIYGPPGMVGAMKNITTQLNCEESKIKAENFIGY